MVCVLFLWEHVTLREKDSFRYPKCGWLSEGENMNYCHSMNMTAGLKIFKPLYCSQRRTTTNIAYTHGWFFTWPEGNKFWFQMYQAGFKGLNSGFTYRDVLKNNLFQKCSIRLLIECSKVYCTKLPNYLWGALNNLMFSAKLDTEFAGNSSNQKVWHNIEALTGTEFCGMRLFPACDFQSLQR